MVQNGPVCSSHKQYKDNEVKEEIRKNLLRIDKNLDVGWTWLKTFSLKALELYTFILTCPLHKSIHNTMIPTAFGYTTKLFY